MKRYAMMQLEEWNSGAKRIPLVIRGARQVGKTWLMQEFGSSHFKKTVYINFDNNQRMKTLFEGDYDISRIIMGLEIESGQNIRPEDTLLVFDEIQEAPQAMSSLKYFNENAPQYAVVAAGSLLGVALHEGTSFPVGKVDFLDLYPMSYLEFLEATGNEKLVNLLYSQDWELIKAFREKYIDLLRQYYFVGGMPEAVEAYTTSGMNVIRRIQTRLLESYEQDFSKHAPNDTVPRIRKLWDSIPAQLAKENKRFLYSAVRKGSRAKDYELALQWMLDCGLVHKVSRVTKPGMPMSAYEDKAFKLYMMDVGMLGAKSGLDVKSLLDGNRIFEEFKGSLTEQFVQQEMRAMCGITPFYWSSDKGNAEIDFLFQLGMNTIPVEVKAEENLRSKSLRSFSERFTPELCVRTSMSDFREESWLTNVPLYAIGLISSILDNSR